MPSLSFLLSLLHSLHVGFLYPDAYLQPFPGESLLTFRASETTCKQKCQNRNLYLPPSLLVHAQESHSQPATTLTSQMERAPKGPYSPLPLHPCCLSVTLSSSHFQLAPNISPGEPPPHPCSNMTQNSQGGSPGLCHSLRQI